MVTRGRILELLGVQTDGRAVEERQGEVVG